MQSLLNELIAASAEYLCQNLRFHLIEYVLPLLLHLWLLLVLFLLLLLLVACWGQNKITHLVLGRKLLRATRKWQLGSHGIKYYIQIKAVNMLLLLMLLLIHQRMLLMLTYLVLLLLLLMN